MLDSVNLCGVHYRFLVWASHTQIKGSDRGTTGEIYAGNVNSGEQRQMVYCEACNFFHIVSVLPPGRSEKTIGFTHIILTIAEKVKTGKKENSLRNT
jgi:hypothetical protein